jgi:protein-disulfide isomerase
MKNWKNTLFLGFVLAGLLSAPLAMTQQPTPPSDDLKKDIEALKEGQKAIQKDLQDIKALLQSRQPAAPAQNVEIDLGKNLFKGQRTAKLTLVEYSDYQ